MKFVAVCSVFACVLGLNLCAQDSGVPLMTEWRSEDGSPPPVYDAPVYKEGLKIESLSGSAGVGVLSASTDEGRVAVIVESGIHSAISTKLSRYISDMEGEGFDVVSYLFSSGTPDDLKSYLQGLYAEPDSLVGAVFVGDIPYIVFEQEDPDLQRYISDAFYMDLDGVWSDTRDSGQCAADNGYYDTVTGDELLEIWTCRMKTSNLTLLGSESYILNNYFDKNYTYRNNISRPAPKALAYLDDDWESAHYQYQGCLETLYGAAGTTVVSDPETTTASDYRNNHMPVDQELIVTWSHGSTSGHQYARNNGSIAEWVTRSDYMTIDPPALFYGMAVCSSGDFREDNCLAAMLAFNIDSGLLSWSATRSAGMYADNYFYEPLAEGACFGKAFVEWYNAVDKAYLFRGQVLFGDASLRPSPILFGFNVSVPQKVYEGDGTLTDAGTISIRYSQSSDLTVNLLSSDTSELSVPSTVTILAGQTSVVFTVTVLNDGVVDPAAGVSVSATATDWVDGSSTVVVDDPAFVGRGSALRFDGGNDYVEIPHSDDLNLTGNHTIEIWFKADDLSGTYQKRGLISKRSSSFYEGWYLTLRDREVSYSNMKTSGLNLQEGQWYHLAGVRSGDTYTLYVNGTAVAVSSTGGPTGGTSSCPVRLGCDYYDFDYYFDGELGEARIWNVARSEQEIHDGMHGYVDRASSGLVACYRLESGAGYLLADETANGHHGALSTGVSWQNASYAYASDIAGENNLCAVWSNLTNSYVSGRMSLVNSGASGLDWCVFGHDGTTESQNSSDKPAGVQWRLNRVWQVECSGTPGATDLYFDLTGLSGGFCLLEDADGTFADASMIAGGTVGSTFVAEDVTMKDGYYYTVGTVDSPVVESDALTNTSASGTECGGTVVAEGDNPVTERGICWNTTGSPTTADTTIPLSSGSGHFSTYFSAPASGTTYYLCAYAISTSGTSYGDLRFFTSDLFGSGAEGLDGVRNSSVIWGDVDNDGDLDLLYCGYNDDAGDAISRYYRNDGISGFVEVSSTVPACDYGMMDFGDYDNDGDLDLFICATFNSGGVQTRLYNNDGGVFTDSGMSFPRYGSGSVDFGDYDHDGDLDLLVAGSTTTSDNNYRIACIYRNNGSSFEMVDVGLEPVSKSCVEWGDYDNDGDLDVLLAGEDASSEISKIYRNDGAGSFVDINAGLAGIYKGGARWGDYDGDGLLDVLLCGNGLTKIYHNNGNDSFVEVNTGMPKLSNGDAAWFDYDSDGDLDAIVSGWDSDESASKTTLYRNNGGSSFSIVSDTGIPDLYYTRIAVGDYDNDGRQDLALTGHGSESEAYIMHGQVASYNTAPSVPGGLSVSSDNTLSWLGASDAETAVAGVRYNLRIGTTPGDDDIKPAMTDSAGWSRSPHFGIVGSSCSWEVGELTPGTQYHWSVRSVDSSMQSSGWSAESTFTMHVLAEVTTAPVTDVGAEWATCGGEVTAQGDSPVSSYGIVWNIGGGATVDSNLGMTVDGSGLGSFTSSLTGLVESTTYRVRAYAVNSEGVAYGDEFAFSTPILPPGNAMSFDGVDSYVRVYNYFGSYEYPPIVITMATWVWHDDWSVASRETLIHCYDGTGVELYLDAGDKLCGTVSPEDYGDLTPECSTADMAPGWHHVALSYDKQYARLYVDGVLRDTQDLGRQEILDWPDNTYVLLGATGTKDPPYTVASDFFTGKLDETRIWKSVRSIDEIRNAMHHTDGVGESDLLVYYTYDQESGTTLYNQSGSAYHDALLRFGPSWVESSVPFVSYTGDSMEIRGAWNGKTNSLASGVCLFSNTLVAVSSDYAVFGHDTGVVAWVGTDLPDNCIQRLERAWRVESTGSVGAELSFDISGLTVADDTRLRLLCDADGVFSSGAMPFAGSMIDGRFVVPLAQVNSLDYFTLGYLTEFANIGVIGEGVNIVDGDTSPSTADGTDLGGEFLGYTNISDFVISNEGEQNLTVSSIAVGGSFELDTPATPFMIAGGGSTNITVRFVPNAIGIENGTVTIDSNDPDDESTFTFAVKGEGVEAAMPDMRPYGMNIDVVQNDTGNTSNSISLCSRQVYRDIRVLDNSNRGDYSIQVGDDRSDDAASGILISSSIENGRDNGESSPLDGERYVTTSIAVSDSEGYFIPVDDASTGSEYNSNVGAVYFPFNEGWICGRTINSSGGAAISSISASPGIEFGEDLTWDDDNRIARLKLPGVDSRTDGVLLVSGGKNEDNYALSKVLSDGSWNIYCHDNGINGGSYESDPIAFAYVPLDMPGVVAGSFDAEADIVIGSGFTVTHTGTGTYELTLDEHVPASGVLIVSAAGGESYNFDNIVNSEAAGTKWIIQTRDISGSSAQPTLQNIATDQIVCSFAFFSSVAESGGGALESGLWGQAYGSGMPTEGFTANNACTLECWVYHDTLESDHISRYVTLASECAVIRHDDDNRGRLHTYFKLDGSLYGFRVDDVLTAGRWHHVAGVWDSTTIKLYLDGELIGSEEQAGRTLTTPSGSVKLGSSSEYLDGKLDEVRVYNVALTQEQIRERMHKKLTGQETGLVACYRMDQNSGTNIIDLCGNVDLQRNENTAWVDSTAPLADDTVAACADLRGAWISRCSPTFESSVMQIDDGDIGGTDYLVFGHDSSALAMSGVLNRPYTFTSRLGRVWRIDESGELESSLEFDTTSITGIVNIDRIHLLVDDDGDFSNAAAFSGSVDGDVFTVDALSIEDGAYYTLAEKHLMYTITATTGSNGSISPVGSVEVPEGGTTNFVFTPDQYYHVDQVETNFVSAGTGTQFVWNNVCSNGEINVEFTADLAAQGTPHWWLDDCGWTTDFDTAEAADTDEDGFTAAQEYLADTNPNDGNDYLCISGILIDPSVGISFVSKRSRWYTLFGCTNLTEDAWVPVAPSRVGVDGSDTMGDGENNSVRFYKLEVELP